MRSKATSSKIDIIPVVTRKQRRQFLDLPGIINRGNPYWVPRIRSSESALVGFRPHSFQRTAESAAFLAVAQGEACGRIVAINNRAHRAAHPTQSLGFVGFYECQNDAEVSNALFDEAVKWLKTRSLDVVRGPVSPSMNYEAGLLIRGFDKSPAFMMPYNPDYYPELWTQYGFTKSQDLFAFNAEAGIVDPSDKIWAISKSAIARFNAKFRQIDRRNFLDDVQTFLRLYNAGSAGTWGFVPFSDEEIIELSKELKYLIIPDITAFMTIDDKVIGAAFGLPDYGPIVRKIGGRLFPFGFLSLLLKRKSISKSRFMSINVLPEYQRWGLGLGLAEYILRHGYSSSGISECEFSYVLESNHLAASTLSNSGATIDKTYRVYDKHIGSSATG